MTRFIVTLLLSLCLAPAAMAAGLIEDSIKLPARFEGFFGDYTANLDALVIRPNDNERHPLAIINHGMPKTSAERQDKSPRGMRAQTLEFARRGWVAVTFTRRGYGASEGHYAEYGGPNCLTLAHEPVAREAADDIREVIRLMKEKPYVDGDKIISVGASMGGFATVALTADPPPGLVAAISFAGGHGATGENHVCNEGALVQAYSIFGETSRIPMLWVYAENDQSFGPDLAHQLHKSFTAAGGKAEFIAAPPFEADGHFLFSRLGTPIWSKYVDAFLKEQNLTVREFPLSLNDETWVPTPNGLGERGRAAFLNFRDARRHKAFAMSADGHFGWRGNCDSDDEAVDQARKLCRQNTNQDCHIVVINDKISP